MSNVENDLSWLYGSPSAANHQYILPSTGRSHTKSRKTTTVAMGDTARVLALDDADDSSPTEHTLANSNKPSTSTDPQLISPSLLSLLDPNLTTPAFLLRLLLPCCICSEPLANAHSPNASSSAPTSMDLTIGSCGHLAHSSCCVSIAQIPSAQAQKIVTECTQAAARRTGSSFDADAIIVLRCPECGPVSTRKLFAPPFTPDFASAAVTAVGEQSKGSKAEETAKMCLSLSSSDVQGGWAGVDTTLKAFDHTIASTCSSTSSDSELPSKTLTTLDSKANPASTFDDEAKALWRPLIEGDGVELLYMSGPSEVEVLREKDDGIVVVIQQPSFVREKKSGKNTQETTTSGFSAQNSGSSSTSTLATVPTSSTNISSPVYTTALLVPVRDDDEAFTTSNTDAKRNITIASQNFSLTPSSVPFELEPLTPLHFRLGCLVVQAECIKTQNDLDTVHDTKRTLEHQVLSLTNEVKALEKEKIASEHDLLVTKTITHESVRLSRESQNKLANLPTCANVLQPTLVRMGLEGGNIAKSLLLRAEEYFDYPKENKHKKSTKLSGHDGNAGMSSHSHSITSSRHTGGRNTKYTLENTLNTARTALRSTTALWSTTITPIIPAIPSTSVISSITSSSSSSTSSSVTPTTPPSQWHKLVAAAGPVSRNMGGVDIVPRAAAWLACCARAMEEEDGKMKMKVQEEMESTASVISPFAKLENDTSLKNSGNVKSSEFPSLASVSTSLVGKGKSFNNGMGADAARAVMHAAHHAFAPASATNARTNNGIGAGHDDKHENSDGDGDGEWNIEMDRDNVRLVREQAHTRVVVDVKLSDAEAQVTTDGDRRPLFANTHVQCHIDTLASMFAKKSIDASEIYMRTTTDGGVVVELADNLQHQRKVTDIVKKMEETPISASCALLRSLEEEFLMRLHQHLSLISRMTAFEDGIGETEAKKRSKEHAQRASKRRKLLSQLKDLEKDTKKSEVVAIEQEKKCEEAKKNCVHTLLDTVADSKEECEALLALLRKNAKTASLPSSSTKSTPFCGILSGNPSLGVKSHIDTDRPHAGMSVSLYDDNDLSPFLHTPLAGASLAHTALSVGTSTTSTSATGTMRGDNGRNRAVGKLHDQPGREATTNVPIVTSTMPMQALPSTMRGNLGNSANPFANNILRNTGTQGVISRAGNIPGKPNFPGMGSSTFGLQQVRTSAPLGASNGINVATSTSGSVGAGTGKGASARTSTTARVGVAGIAGAGGVGAAGGIGAGLGSALGGGLRAAANSFIQTEIKRKR